MTFIIKALLQTQLPFSLCCLVCNILIHVGNLLISILHRESEGNNNNTTSSNNKAANSFEHNFKLFTCINSLNPHSSPIKWASQLSSLYTQARGTHKHLVNLAEIRPLGNGRVSLSAIFWFQSSRFGPLCRIATVQWFLVAKGLVTNLCYHFVI